MRARVRRPGHREASDRHQPISKVDGTAGTLWTLLQPKRGKFQDPGGQYAGRVCSLSIDDWERHIRGERTVAVRAVRNRRAKWCVIDDDLGRPSHLPIYRDVLTRLGLEKASIATPGSDTSRMKIIVVFDQPIPQHQAAALVTTIADLVRRDSRITRCEASALTLFPNPNDGGVVRILGRHNTRGTKVEMPLDLTGNPASLNSIEPASHELIESIVPLEARIDAKPGVPPYLQRWLSTPWRAGHGHNAILDRLVTMARDILRREGEHRGFHTFIATVEAIVRLSPALNARAGGGRRRGRLGDRGRLERLWQFVVSRPSRWIRLQPSLETVTVRLPRYAGEHGGQTYRNTSVSAKSKRALRVSAERRAWDVYNALADLVVDRGCNPHCFSVDLATIADRIPLRSRMLAHRYLSYAQRLGLLVRLDPGTADRKGSKGLCAIYSLCGRGECLEDAVADGKTRTLYKERINMPVPPSKPKRDGPVSPGNGHCAVYGRSIPTLGLATPGSMNAQEIAYAENYRQGGHQRAVRSRPRRLARKVAKRSAVLGYQAR